MPIRQANNTTRDRDGIIRCINETYTALRNQSALADGIDNWTAATLAAWSAAGYRGWVWDSSVNSTIMGVLIGGIEQHTRAPDVTPRPWLAIKVIGARLDLIPDVGTDRERAILRPVIRAVSDTLSESNVAGVRMIVDHRNSRLIAFVRNAFPLSNDEEATPTGVKFWLRLKPGTPELTAATAGLTD